MMKILFCKINCTYIEELAKKYKVDANVIGFTSGEAVIDFMKQQDNNLSIVFMDVDLKGMNGIKTASLIMKRNPKIVTIFITGHKEFAYDAFTVEAFSFLIKPINPGSTGTDF